MVQPLLAHKPVAGMSCRWCSCLLQDSSTNHWWPLTNRDAALSFPNAIRVCFRALDLLLNTTEYVHAFLAVNASTSACFSNRTDYHHLIRLYFLISGLWSSGGVEGMVHTGATRPPGGGADSWKLHSIFAMGRTGQAPRGLGRRL